MAAPSSATQSAPQSETSPPAIHTRMVGKEPEKAAAIEAGTMKIDEPMMVPTLIIVSSSRPSSRRRPSLAEAIGYWLIAYHGASRYPMSNPPLHRTHHAARSSSPPALRSQRSDAR